MLVDRPSRTRKAAIAELARRVTVGLARKMADRNGLRLVPASEATSDECRVRMLRADAITVVLDVGANEGQYGQALRRSGWMGRIVSFEPQAAAFGALAARARSDDRWEARRLAVGAVAESLVINVSAASMSSSFLPMHANHEELVPGSGYVATERVDCVALDGVFHEYVLQADRVALKIDVQGFESRVLAGAARSLRRITLVELELCLTELYVGQPRTDEIVATLAAAGFELVAIDPEHVDPDTGRTSWANATFRRA
jgi:FkbM family methyltransferase